MKFPSLKAYVKRFRPVSNLSLYFLQSSSVMSNSRVTKSSSRTEEGIYSKTDRSWSMLNWSSLSNVLDSVMISDYMSLNVFGLSPSIRYKPRVSPQSWANDNLSLLLLPPFIIYSTFNLTTLPTLFIIVLMNSGFWVLREKCWSSAKEKYMTSWRLICLLTNSIITSWFLSINLKALS